MNRHPEREHLTSGNDEHEVFDTPLGKVGMLICWDLAFPEAFRELICQGAKLIIIPSFWTLNDCSEEGLKYNPSSEAVFLDSFLTARTFENTCGESVSKYANQCNELINAKQLSSQMPVVLRALDMQAFHRLLFLS